MIMYAQLDIKNTPELNIERHGWLNPEYELTGSGYSYGKMAYNGISRREVAVQTAADTWLFSFKDFFGRAILITHNGEIAGEVTRDWLSRRHRLTMKDGFTAEFYRPLLWQRDYVWESGSYGTIMHIWSTIFTLNTTVLVEQSNAPTSVILLLSFLGIHLNILRKRRRAAR